jgi:hypothetical protein
MMPEQPATHPFRKHNNQLTRVYPPDKVDLTKSIKQLSEEAIKQAREKDER